MNNVVRLSNLETTEQLEARCEYWKLSASGLQKRLSEHRQEVPIYMGIAFAAGIVCGLTLAVLWI